MTNLCANNKYVEVKFGSLSGRTVSHRRMALLAFEEINRKKYWKSYWENKNKYKNNILKILYFYMSDTFVLSKIFLIPNNIFKKFICFLIIQILDNTNIP